MSGAAKAHGRRAALFGGVGVINTAADFIVFAALLLAGVDALAANAVAFLLANAQSYLLNARVTFRREGAPAPLSFTGYAKFAGAHVVSLAFSILMIAFAGDAIGDFAAKIIAFVLAFFWNYAASAFFVFGPRARDGEAR